MFSKFADRIPRGVENGAWWASALMLGVCACFVTVEVILRYFFHLSHDFGDLAILYMVLFAALIPACGVLIAERDISLDVIYVRVHGAWRRRLQIVNFTASVIACAALAMFTFDLGMRYVSDKAFQPFVSFNMPLCIPPFILCLSMTLTTLLGLIRLTTLIKGRDRGED